MVVPFIRDLIMTAMAIIHHITVPVMAIGRATLIPVNPAIPTVTNPAAGMGLAAILIGQETGADIIRTITGIAEAMAIVETTREAIMVIVITRAAIFVADSGAVGMVGEAVGVKGDAFLSLWRATIL
ncbi:MAG: hypothetical protein ACRERV_03325 [Methylococcales bacterium]